MQNQKSKTKKNNFATKKLFGFIFSNKKLLFSVFFLLIVAIVMGQFTPYLTKFMVNKLEAGENASAIIFFGIAAGVLLFIESFCIFIQAKALGSLGNKVANEIRAEALENVTKLPLSHFESKPIGSMLVKTTTYANEVGTFFTLHMPNFTINTIRLLAIFAFMMSLNIYISLLAIAFLGFTFFVMKTLGSVIKKKNTEYKQTDIDRCGLIYENIKGLRTIISNNRKQTNLEKYEDMLDVTNVSFHRYAAVNNLLSPLIETIWNIALVGIYLFSFWLVQSAGVSVETGVIVAFMGYMVQATVPISETGVVLRNLAAAYGALDQIYDNETLMLLSSGGQNRKKRTLVVGDAPSIVVEKLCLSNKFRGDILKNISFDIQYGEKVFISGQSGSGKTQLAKILSGQYAADSGTATLDGKAIESVSQESLYKTIGVLTSENFIFNGSIKENILVSNPNATEEEFLKAIKISGVEGFTSKLTGGVETIVGNSEIFMSEGEKLLIGLARLILQNPSIVILHEALNPLDSRREQRFLKNFNKVFALKTIVYVDVAKKDFYKYNKRIKIESGEIVEISTNTETEDQE